MISSWRCSDYLNGDGGKSSGTGDQGAHHTACEVGPLHARPASDRDAIVGPPTLPALLHLRSIESHHRRLHGITTQGSVGCPIPSYRQRLDPSAACADSRIAPAPP